MLGKRYKVSVMQDELILEICCTAKGLWSTILHCPCQVFLLYTKNVKQVKEMMDISIILDIVVMVTQVYAYVQMYQTVYIKYVHFIVC